MSSHSNRWDIWLKVKYVFSRPYKFSPARLGCKFYTVCKEYEFTYALQGLYYKIVMFTKKMYCFCTELLPSFCTGYSGCMNGIKIQEKKKSFYQCTCVGDALSGSVHHGQTTIWQAEAAHSPLSGWSFGRTAGSRELFCQKSKVLFTHTWNNGTYKLQCMDIDLYFVLLGWPLFWTTLILQPSVWNAQEVLGCAWLCW